MAESIHDKQKTNPTNPTDVGRAKNDGVMESSSLSPDLPGSSKGLKSGASNFSTSSSSFNPEAPLPSMDELRDLQLLLKRGLTAPREITIAGIGIILVLVAILFLVVMRDMGGKNAFPEILTQQLDDQARRDSQTYVLKTPQSEVWVPGWPLTLYQRLRQDMLLLAAGVLLVALAMSSLSRASLMRQDLLLLRALAREVNRLRYRLEALEKNLEVDHAQSLPKKSNPDEADKNS